MVYQLDNSHHRCFFALDPEHQTVQPCALNPRPLRDHYLWPIENEPYLGDKRDMDSKQACLLDRMFKVQTAVRLDIPGFLSMWGYEALVALQCQAYPFTVPIYYVTFLGQFPLEKHFQSY